MSMLSDHFRYGNALFLAAFLSLPWDARATEIPAGKAPPWAEILGPPQGQLPAPRATVVWEDDLSKALAEARKENRPLFVTMRCLPCKQCSIFDKDVLEGGPRLDPLLKQFVTVRLIDAAAIDLNLFPVDGFQDLDLSWWGWFLSPEGRIYGVFGGKDHVSDATRISVDALAKALRRVLAHHYDPRRAAWNIDGRAPAMDQRSTPPQLPGYKSWLLRGSAEEKKATCLHCHQIAEILRQPRIDAGQFDKQRDLDIWPLPENVGIVLDRDDGLLVRKVEPDSPAAKAGIRAGDSLAAAADRRLFSQADFRGALHRGPRGAGAIPVYWSRGEKLMNATLQVAEGWRKTILDWRMSISQGNIGAGPGGFFPLALSAEDRQRHGIAADTMAVKPFIGPQLRRGPAFQAGLRDHHVIVAVDRKNPPLAGRAFLVWFRLHHEPGDSVTLTVLDGSEKRDFTYKLESRKE